MIRRKDDKGRVLKDGESQRNDGRYQFRYAAENGQRYSIYAKSLKDLREKEKEILRNLEDGIRTTAKNVTLNEIYEVHMQSKTELKQSTRGNYKYLYQKYVKDTIGYRRVAEIRYSDMNAFYRKLADEGFKPHSLESIHSVLHPIFTMAVRDGYIRYNPTDGLIGEIKKSRHWEDPKRHALTIDEQARVIEFLKNSKKFNEWLNLFLILLGTGLRVSELCGLRWQDCDFENGIISVKRNLIYKMQENGKAEFHVTTPKTSAGVRVVPMLTAVKNALQNEYNKQLETGFNKTEVDGYTGFIFMTKSGNVTCQHNVTRALKRIVVNCNRDEEERAKLENRNPFLVKDFSAHSLRHTFCTRFCENETNVKVIQEIMGHSDIATTMNIYAEVTVEKKKAVFRELDSKIQIM